MLPELPGFEHVFPLHTMADALTHRGIEVQLVGRSASVDPEIGDLIQQQLKDRAVQVHTGISIDRIRKTPGDLIVEGPNGFSLTANLIVWATGVRPASRLAERAGVEIGSRGACKVTRRMETNIPGVFAAGGDAEFAGVVGTQVVKVFELAIARTGLLDHEARAAGFAPVTVPAHAYDHKRYYPDADELCLRITGDTQTGHLLGAQIAGNWKAEAAKRIDIFATALFHRMKVQEINALDLSYTPPLASPWDAVQIEAQTWAASQRKVTT